MKKIWRVLYEVIFKNLPSSQVVGGKYFKKLRMMAVRKFVEYCGSNVNIEPKAIISHKLKIGDGSGIGKNSYCSGNITIGKDVMMGPECVILTRNHAFDRVDIPMRKQGYLKVKRTDSHEKADPMLLMASTCHAESLITEFCLSAEA